MTEDLSSRLSGAFMLLLAMLGISWMELGFQRDGTCSVAMVLVLPFTAAVALDLLLHAPKIPVETITTREGFCLTLGALVGLVNLHRFGAFSEGSSVRTPLLVGVAFACSYFAGVQLWHHFRS